MHGVVNLFINSFFNITSVYIKTINVSDNALFLRLVKQSKYFQTNASKSYAYQLTKTFVNLLRNDDLIRDADVNVFNLKTR